MIFIRLYEIYVVRSFGVFYRCPLIIITTVNIFFIFLVLPFTDSRVTNVTVSVLNLVRKTESHVREIRTR